MAEARDAQAWAAHAAGESSKKLRLYDWARIPLAVIPYDSLCEHYGMTASRNNCRIAHVNGALESRNGHLK
ncbi:MAG: hypothetical protein WCZ23_17910 [Rhodospirillaceae bacterium]